ncbi:MAG: thioredoxin domain-containing protein [Haloferacaceae archaeon]
MSAPSSRNRLDEEASPYLRQHADNPVNWQPWDDEALSAARERDVPIFLSIGYAACHWCHVMESESFADESIAEVLNEEFVPIKVDREERPDVDSIYMTVCQLVTGGGGWPLSAWLTPKGKPFYVGTYFPPESGRGRPGFEDVCRRIAASWNDPEQRREMEARADQWTEAARDHLESSADLPSTAEADSGVSGADSGVPGDAEPVEDASEAGAVDPDPLGGDLLDSAVNAALRSADAEHGGFGNDGAQFPQPGRLDLLLRGFRHSDREGALSAATRTLDAMATGGMYDHVGGGFHRYAVDREWTVPHFEKMLYDNALLPPVYLDAHRITGSPTYARVAEETFEFLEREFRVEGGGFAATLDAESDPPAGRDGGPSEGGFYVWTPDEVRDVVDEPTATLLCERYGIAPGGNFEGGTTVPTISASVESLAADRDAPVEEIEAALAEGREALFEAREARPRPARDDKVIAAWNGLAVSAFARGALALDPELADAARRVLSFVRDRLFDPAAGEAGRLDRRWLDGDVAGPGYLDDYAFLARGAFDLYQATGEVEPLSFALTLSRAAIAEFWDEESGTLYYTPESGEQLLVRPQEFADGSTPSSLGVATELFAELDAFAPAAGLGERADRVLATHADRIRASPLEHVSLVRAAERRRRGGLELTIAAETFPEAWRESLSNRYLPGAVLAHRPPTEAGLEEWLETLGLSDAPPIWADRGAAEGEPTVYACREFSCSPPRTSIEAALEWFDAD